MICYVECEFFFIMLIDSRHFILISSQDHFPSYTSFWINLPLKSGSDNKDICRYSTLIIDIFTRKHTSLEFFSFYIIHYSSSLHFSFPFPLFNSSSSAPSSFPLLITLPLIPTTLTVLLLSFSPCIA